MNEPPREEDYLGQFPLSFGGIAPFYADLDTTGGYGKVYYREDSSPDILQLAAKYIKRGFPDTTFDPHSVVIVTWDSVAPYAGPGADTILQVKVSMQLLCNRKIKRDKYSDQSCNGYGYI